MASGAAATPRRHLARSLLGLSLLSLALLGTSEADAQIVVGHLVEAGTRTPLEGALVVLIWTKGGVGEWGPVALAGSAHEGTAEAPEKDEPGFPKAKGLPGIRATH